VRFDNERQNGGAAPYWGKHRRPRLPAHTVRRLAYRQDLRAARELSSRDTAGAAGPGASARPSGRQLPS
jgi:hypothetical protein